MKANRYINYRNRLATSCKIEHIDVPSVNLVNHKPTVFCRLSAIRKTQTMWTKWNILQLRAGNQSSGKTNSTNQQLLKNSFLSSVNILCRRRQALLFAVTMMVTKGGKKESPALFQSGLLSFAELLDNGRQIKSLPAAKHFGQGIKIRIYGRANFLSSCSFCDVASDFLGHPPLQPFVCLGCGRKVVCPENSLQVALTTSTHIQLF